MPKQYLPPLITLMHFRYRSQVHDRFSLILVLHLSSHSCHAISFSLRDRQQDLSLLNSNLNAVCIRKPLDLHRSYITLTSIVIHVDMPSGIAILREGSPGTLESSFSSRIGCFQVGI
ncbi:hypothetical protein L207DRAFT_72560 [Hyaloscypha variabilis F]|uniref:Uncharacterized protein n=1 Tax=Hyaloscypha variabilis (strain UAMH 11265 / GT02V1 / F) TaxID=1149755 RepID=A0A2J6RFG6_HYAVF|nr:hypothetical protein L207DRAFT_72560 [Hyaloscypha variabilis F]